MTTSELENRETLTCPACNGAGEREEMYRFKPRHRYDVHGESLTRREACPLCGGEPATRERLGEWQALQKGVTCPSCAGSGGKRWWRWGESEGEDEQVFSFAVCKVCGGGGRVLPEAKQAYESYRRRVQFTTLFAALAVIGFGLWGATALVSAVITQTPVLLCCPPPHFLFPVAAVFYLVVRRGLSG